MTDSQVSAQGNGAVYLVDDDPMILSALSRLLRAAGFEVHAFASSRDFLSHHDPQLPGCALLDIGMRELDGLSLQEALAAGGVERPIIFVTGCDDVRVSVRAMKAGARDYLTKPIRETDLIVAVEAAILQDRHARQAREEIGQYQDRYTRLTPREREVMAHVIAGRLNKQIANDLGTVEKTVKVHRARIMEKMQVRSVANLVHLAERLGVASARPPR